MTPPPYQAVFFTLIFVPVALNLIGELFGLRTLRLVGGLLGVIALSIIGLLIIASVIHSWLMNRDFDRKGRRVDRVLDALRSDCSTKASFVDAKEVPYVVFFDGEVFQRIIEGEHEEISRDDLAFKLMWVKGEIVISKRDELDCE